MQTMFRLATFVGVAALVGCAGTMSTKSQPKPLIERIDPTGVSPRIGAVESGTLIRFVNDDVRPHEIYSSDCRELASQPLAPGQAFVAELDVGPRLCHFQDLLAPTSAEYWGTVQVAEPPAPNDFGSGS
jgi:hypothetical protein